MVKEKETEGKVSKISLTLSMHAIILEPYAC